jgi:branched-chain amino acid aminotransferase
MTETLDIKITKTNHSRLAETDFSNLAFGRTFSDHMLVADYADGEWKNFEIVPYGTIVVSPGISALHYGQSFFEGIKAYKHADGKVSIFRPDKNAARFNKSAERLCMPTLPEDIFLQSLAALVDVDRDWIPAAPNHSLYIRPFMFATDEVIGVKPAETYKFLILLSPTGPYYSAPMRIYVEEKYTRAAKGGIGFAKAAGNYGSSLLATAIAKQKGFDQVLWTDAFEHKYVQEIGTMNFFVIIGKKAITPDLEAGTILEGVTRDSAIEALKELGYEVEERPISIDEIIRAHKAGELKELFGTGTAATVSMIQELCYQDYNIKFDTSTWKAVPAVKKLLTDIREGRVADTRGWMFKV